MTKIDELIRHIYDYPYQKMVDIEYDKNFGNEIEVGKLIDTLLGYGLINVVDNTYCFIRVEPLPNLRKVVNSFNGNFDEYTKSLTEKDDLEIEKLNYEKSIRELQEENTKLSSKNLTLQNWDIKFRWVISFITFIIGLVIEHSASLIDIIVQMFL